MTLLGMTFNYADLAIVAIVLIAAIVGFCRGILINFINFIRLSVGTFLCFFTAEYGSRPVYEQFVKPKLVEGVTNAVSGAANVEEMSAGLNEFTAGLPKFIADNADLQQVNYTSEDVAETIVNSVFEPAALFLVKVALFIAVFIVFFGISWLIIHFVKKRMKKKDAERGHTTALRKTDKVLGLFFGILKAAVIVLAISAVLMYILQLKPALGESNSFWKQISESTLMANIKEINPFNAITEEYI